MRLVRVAAAALNQTPLDWNANAQNIRQAIREAREADARLLCLPELCITGYGCEDAFYSRGVTRMAERVLAELLPEAALGRELTWEADDIALQNIQARSRGPSVWMLANVKNALLLATSNRSEAAVGYTTMDGDTCGGLSPIAGIDKAFLRKWLRWLETEGLNGLGPITEVKAVTGQQPTAELRPQEAGQTDEEDLMPYDLLDAIEDHAIGEKRTPEETLAAVAAEFSQYDSARLAAWVRRFFELWSRNQWKRERYAPSFHVDDKNLDPKTWCRFPILSGCFRRELAELPK